MNKCREKAYFSLKWYTIIQELNATLIKWIDTVLTRYSDA